MVKFLAQLAVIPLISQLVLADDGAENYGDGAHWPQYEGLVERPAHEFSSDSQFRVKSNEHFYTAWKHSWPTQVPIEYTIRHKYCKVFHNSTVLGSKFGDTDQQDCRDHFWKHGLRNYGCNCFSDNADYTFLNWRARQFGLRAIHMANNGEARDFVDSACQKTWHRFRCLDQDVRNGVYPNLKEGIYPTRHWLDPGPIHGMNWTMRWEICQAQDTSIYGQEVEDYTIWGWEDQCAKLQRYECGHNLEYPYFIDAAGDFHCGYEDNPDYVNGTPIGEECNRDVCLIAQQFADEVIAGLIERGYGPESYDYDNQVNGGLWKYLVDNRDNYLVYENHPNITSGVDKGCCHTDGAATNMYEQWPIEWDMNTDTAGNLPNYFPYDPPDFVPTDGHSQQYEPLVHWYKDYSTAKDKCFHTPKIHLTDPGDTQCCGTQPHRYPYQDKLRDCCAGTISPFGSCP